MVSGRPASLSRFSRPASLIVIVILVLGMILDRIIGILPNTSML